MKTLLVLGASSDIGIFLIKRVHRSYGHIWAHYFHWNDKLEDLKELLGEKIQFICADLFSISDCEKLTDIIRNSEFLPNHIVLLPMTKIIAQKFIKTKWEDFNNGWEVSIRSAVLLLHAFLPIMKKKKSGKVVFMLSSVTSNTPPKYESAYITVKYALLGLMKSLAAEYTGSGVCINGVSPDMIQTKFLNDLPRLLVAQYAETRPQKRILNVDEIIPIFEFLLSDNANAISGENIVIQ